MEKCLSQAPSFQELLFASAELDIQIVSGRAYYAEYLWELFRSLADLWAY